LSVSVENRQRHVRVSSARLAAVARAALSSLRRVDRDLDVTVVGDREIRRLHERYLGVRRATDVLAFDLAGPGPSRLLGQVIISADTAARQAARLGVAVAQEMDLLLVHGLLHLAGYDDHDPQKARLMHERAHQILSRARRRPPPARLWAGLIDAGAGARALAPAARRRSLVRLSQRPLMVAGESSHRS
jgi:probable rRNA maturation factor